MSESMINADEFFGMFVTLHAPDGSAKRIPIYDGSDGFLAWIDAGRPQGLDAVLWAATRGLEVSYEEPIVPNKGITAEAKVDGVGTVSGP